MSSIISEVSFIKRFHYYYISCLCMICCSGELYRRVSVTLQRNLFVCYSFFSFPEQPLWSYSDWLMSTYPGLVFGIVERALGALESNGKCLH